MKDIAMSVVFWAFDHHGKRLTSWRLSTFAVPSPGVIQRKDKIISAKVIDRVVAGADSRYKDPRRGGID